jgi:hypothetical protein
MQTETVTFKGGGSSVVSVVYQNPKNNTESHISRIWPIYTQQKLAQYQNQRGNQQTSTEIKKSGLQIWSEAVSDSKG